MGTNYYRIPTEEEVEKRKAKLIKRIKSLELTPSNIERNFSTLQGEHEWDTFNPWDEFTSDLSIHLGKRSAGWLFCWNFHKDQYYNNKATLLQFIRAGRVVNEYGCEEDPEEFIKMALDWGKPDGLRYDAFYIEQERKNSRRPTHFDNPTYYDRNIDGLRVSSSTDFS